MQIEVKLCLRDAEGFHRTVRTLANCHLKDECYYDVFFDFPYGPLKERGSVLRLRVACDPSSVPNDASAAALDSNSSAATAYGGTANVDREAESEAWPRVFRGQPAAPSTLASLSTATATTADLYHSGSAAVTDGLPFPTFIRGAAGKVTFKGKNTVEQGLQLSFSAEEPNVPPAVVEALLQLVPESLLTTGAIAGTDTSVSGDAFPVLAAYAQERPLNDDGTGKSAISHIVAHLRDIAAGYASLAAASAAAGGGSRPGSAARSQDVDSSNAHFAQVRYAGMGTHSLSTQKQLASSQPTGGNAVVAAEPQVVVVAGFMTLRRVFAYTPIVALQEDPTHPFALSPRDMALRELLRVRLDASYFLPRLTIYELEVPKCGSCNEEVAQEVSRFLQKISVPFHLGNESKLARYMQCLAATRETEQDVSDVKLRLTNVNGYEEVYRNLEQLLVHSANGGSGPVSRHKRQRVSNTEVSPVEGEEGGDETWWNTNSKGYLEETNEDFFFDSPEQTLRRGQTFLRLRWQHHSNKYELAMKSHQVFSEGQQKSMSSKIGVSATVARALVDNPTQFLVNNVEHVAVIRTIWEEFGVRELCRTATFTTKRITVPWWTAQSQTSTMLRSWSAGGPASTATLTPQSQPIYTSASYMLSQKYQQQQGGGGGALASTQSPVPPLLIHLDRTLYKLPVAAQAPRVPFSEPRTWGEQTLETYEMEVTNIAPPTEVKAVVKELTAVLNGLGVEWQDGTRSKVEQYFKFINM